MCPLLRETISALTIGTAAELAALTLFVGFVIVLGSSAAETLRTLAGW